MAKEADNGRPIVRKKSTKMMLYGLYGIEFKH